jgi:hypothetical protein
MVEKVVVLRDEDFPLLKATLVAEFGIVVAFVVVV